MNAKLRREYIIKLVSILYLLREYNIDIDYYMNTYKYDLNALVNGLLNDRKDIDRDRQQEVLAILNYKEFQDEEEKETQSKEDEKRNIMYSSLNLLCKKYGFEAKVIEKGQNNDKTSSFKIKVTARSQAVVDNLIGYFYGDERKKTAFETGEDGSLYLAVYDSKDSVNSMVMFDKIKYLINHTDERYDYLKGLPDTIVNEEIRELVKNPKAQKEYNDLPSFRKVAISYKASVIKDAIAASKEMGVSLTVEDGKKLIIDTKTSQKIASDDSSVKVSDIVSSFNPHDDVDDYDEEIEVVESIINEPLEKKVEATNFALEPIKEDSIEPVKTLSGAVLDTFDVSREQKNFENAIVSEIAPNSFESMINFYRSENTKDDGVCIMIEPDKKGFIKASLCDNFNASKPKICGVFSENDFASIRSNLIGSFDPFSLKANLNGNNTVDFVMSDNNGCKIIIKGSNINEVNSIRKESILSVKPTPTSSNKKVKSFTRNLASNAFGTMKGFIGVKSVLLVLVGIIIVSLVVIILR